MKAEGSSITPVMIDMLVRVIHAEGFLNSGALGHELDGATRVRRDVTDGQEPEDHRSRV